MQGRNLTFDIMRGLGILSLIIAHSEPPSIVFQLRNFGVPLLILVSAMVYAQMDTKRFFPASIFLKKRLSKLIVPTWAFLSFFFLAFSILPAPEGGTYPFTWKEILNSYSLNSGIGYVWIIRVYIFLALITPFVVLLRNKIYSSKNYFFLLALVYLVYEVAYALASNYIIDAGLDGSLWWSLSKDTFFTIIPYGILYAYGFKLESFKNSTLCVVGAVSFVIFLMCASYLFYEHGKLIQTQEYKYPPQLYYFSYAFGCVHLIYLIFRKVRFPAFFNMAMTYLSKHSFGIYLWHIMFIFIWKFYVGSLNVPGEWIVKSVIILLISSAFAGAQSHIFDMLFSTRLENYKVRIHKTFFKKT